MKKWLFMGLCVLSLGSLRAASVRLLDGDVIEGKIDLGPQGITVTKPAGFALPVDLLNVLEISFRKAPSPSATLLPAGVLLANGTAIAERNLPGVDQPTVTVGAERVPVPTAAIAWLVFNPIPRAKLDAAPAGQTGGLLEGGDFFPGTFVGLKGGRVSLNSVLFGPQAFTPKTQIDAVCLHELKAAPARFVVTTISGSRFVTDEVRFDTGVFTVKDSLLGPVRLKTDDLESLRAGPGRYQALAEQKPFKIETRAGADAAATMQVQKGDASTAAIVTIAANLAVTYTVPPGFTTFASGVSVPKSANPNYRIAFAVYGDGHPLFRTPLFGLLDKPQPLRVELKGARVVTLRVEPAGVAAGGGDWIAPTLLR